MKLSRRQFLHVAAGAAALPVVSPVARAQTYPVRPVRVIDGSPPGGTTDILARLMSQWLTERLGQPFLVENRGGAGGNVAAEAVIRSPADGYTLLLVAPNNATLYERTSFDFLRDIAPVAGLIRTTNVMVVGPTVPAKTVLEFIEFAKANPKRLNMASAGNGTTLHVSGELFSMMAGIELVHVPYRGTPPAFADLLGGQVQVMFPSLPSSIEYIRAGKIRALAVTSAARLQALPDLPTVSDFLPGFESSAFFGVGAPRNTPPEIIERLNREINAGLADPKLKARLADLGGAVLPGSAADFGALVATEIEKWGKVVKLSGANLR
jgi:tripartite-type tricarboxylate transporter receptor subunit TctC